MILWRFAFSCSNFFVPYFVKIGSVYRLYTAFLWLDLYLIADHLGKVKLETVWKKTWFSLSHFLFVHEEEFEFVLDKLKFAVKLDIQLKFTWCKNSNINFQVFGNI